jgi:2-amino-4-hydroxy-6-hydroxymethyldihydropteridine diphosphokinase
VRRAWAAVSAGASSARLSRVYESRPLYVADQPLYLNAVGEIVTDCEPYAFLDRLHQVETALGRDRTREIRMGPRTCDLDILLCGDLVLDSADLVIPHPRIAERAFVLVPLLELQPEARDPRSGRLLAEVLDALDRAAGGPGARGVYLSEDG